MKALQYIILSLLLLLMMESCQEGKAPEQESVITEKTEQSTRIISLNGTITELLYAMNYGDKIVGVDVTSTYPKATQTKPSLGHVHQLNAEAILALQPTLILIDERGNQSPAIITLKESGIPIATITLPQTLEGSLQAAQQIEQLLEVEFDTQALEEKIQHNQQELAQFLAKYAHSPKVLFIYARGAQTMMVGGKNTFAESMIQLAGGELAIQGIEDFKPLTPEALLKSQPEVILMFDSGLESLAEEGNTALEQLLQVPGIAQTPAGANKKIVTMEGLYLSGFGPRASEAVLELAKAIHL